MKQVLLNFIEAVDGLLVIYVVITATIKIIVDSESRAFFKAMATYFIGVPVGILAALIAQEYNVQNATSIAIGCICCLLAEKIIFLVMDLNIQRIFKSWIDRKLK